MIHNGKGVNTMPLMTYRRNGDSFPCVINPDIKLRWVVGFISQLLDTQ